MELNKIVTGDSKELSKAIPDESIDLLFTDPVYENIEDYTWLGETAMRVLKPNGVLLTWCSVRCAARAQIALEETGLTYHWTLYYAKHGGNSKLFGYNLYSKITPCFFFAKGRSKANFLLPDIINSADPPDFNKNDPMYFAWHKNLAILARYIETFSMPDDIVFDPFAGIGSVPVACKTTGRNYIAFEIDHERAEKARQRIETTSLPLFVLEPEQVKFEFETA